MKNSILFVAAFVLAACGKNADTGGTIPVANGGFEQTASDGSIPGWTAVQHAGPPSYEMVVEARGAYAGNGSFRITRTREQFYGSIKQDVAVGKFAGGWVELSAMVKTRDVGPQGWQLMIIAPAVREFSPVLTGTHDWQRASVRAQLPKGTSTISIGATLLDSGSGWLDEVELRAISP